MVPNDGDVSNAGDDHEEEDMVREERGRKTDEEMVVVVSAEEEFGEGRRVDDPENPEVGAFGFVVSRRTNLFPTDISALGVN